MTEKILDQLGKDTAPRNFEEFELGMTFAALILEMEQDEDFDPTTFDALVEKAPKVLEYWRAKYANEIVAAGNAARKSFNNRK